ncbi:Dam family site-specific DNA-(adenine-N6)-methyltransferase [Holdemanella biformis]|uniref:Dam family site-specific DNA-(adenine-N6)-methyltransferase n=1 Tax=Holdemanella biformis TaxID=1735 RepID=UPI00249230BE|nr:Dam family site-specific DNA-(adenine-N6)-methyltransferase [Holdemanella biformis]
MPEKNIIRSPFFYVGDKYKLMPQLKQLMPDDIDNYIEPFVGGGSSFLNSKGNRYILNDIDKYVIKLHKELAKYVGKREILLKKIYKIIDEYGLSCSYRDIVVSDELKKQYPKTYYAKYNKAGYESLRRDFNKTKRNILKLYVLLIYGFNHMIRFNASGEFNLPVGNVDFNKNVYNALCNYLAFIEKNEIVFYNYDYQKFLNQLSFTKNSYVFLDPPYLISMSEYNKLWNEKKEKELCDFLDKLNEKGVRFGITNLITHKGKTNSTFSEWAKKYYIYDIDSNYISFNDNTIKEGTKEVFVTNYGKRKK